MKNIFMKILLTLLLTSIATGCAKVWNPYKDDFECKGNPNGRCTTMMGAYKDSFTEKKVEPIDNNTSQKKSRRGKKDKAEEVPVPTPGEIYNNNRYNTLSNLITEPKAPIVVPPTVVRVLIPPYTGADNNMYDSRFIYFFATEPQWQLATGYEREE